MMLNCFQLNAGKTEIIWCSLCRRQHQIPDMSLVLDFDALMLVRSVRNLGIDTYSGVSMWTQRRKDRVGLCVRFIASLDRSPDRSFYGSSY